MKEIKRFSIMGGIVHAALFFTVMILAFFDVHFILTKLISSLLMTKSVTIISILLSTFQGFCIGFSLYLLVGSMFYVLDKY